MASVNVEITGDARKLEQTFTKIEAGQDKVEKGFGSVAETAKDSARQIEAANEAAATKGLGSYSRIVTELKRQGPEGRAQAKAIEEYLEASGKAGRRSLSEIVDELKQIDPAAASAAKAVTAEMAAADEASQFAETLKSLRGMGATGKATADAIQREMQEADARSRFDATVASLQALHPTAIDVAARVRQEMDHADKQSEFDRSLHSLQALGGTAAQMATAIRDELKAAAAESAGDMDQILAKLIDINPTVAGAAQRVKTELAEAARFSEGQFESTLGKLRSMGPTGRQVATELKTHLVAAGELSEESIEDVIRKIREIDPAAADAAEKIHQNINKATEKSGKSFESFGNKAKNQILGIAGAYLSINKAIETVIALNRKVIDTNREVFNSLRKTQSGDARLLQVASGATQEEKQADFEAMRSRADKLSADYGLDREEARQLVFSARSEGFESSLDFIAKNRQAINVQAQAGVAGQLPTLFSGQGLTPEQAISGTLVGAQQSRLDFEQLSRALPGAAEGGALQGASAEETIAAVSVMASAFKSGDQAGDRFKALATKLSLDQGVDNTAEIASAQAFVAATSHGKVDVNDGAIDEKTRGEFEALQEKRERAQIRINQIDEKTSAGKDTEKDRFDREQMTRFLNESTKFWETKRKEAEGKIASLTAEQRGSLAGMGVIAAVKQLQQMPEGQRREFLGNSQEANVAYSVLERSLEEIEKRQNLVVQSMDQAGSSQGVVEQASKIAELDPALRAQQQVDISERRQEIAREDRRAVTEGSRQTRSNQALTSAELRNVPQMQIAAAEMATSSLEGLGADPATVVSIITNDQLINLTRDLSAAVDRGNRDALSPMIAIDELANERNRDQSAIASPTSVAGLATSLTGQIVTPDQITQEMRETVTAVIDQSAAQTRNALSAVLVGPGRLATEGGNTVEALRQALKPLIDQMSEANRLQREQLTAQQTTADNTKPPKPNPSDTIRAAAAQSDARAPR